MLTNMDWQKMYEKVYFINLINEVLITMHVHNLYEEVEESNNLLTKYENNDRSNELYSQMSKFIANYKT